jgi:hypothetical protein
VGTLSFCVAFRHQWLARPADDRAKWLANIPQPERRQRLQSTLELGLHSPFFMPAFERYHKLFDDFEIAAFERYHKLFDDFEIALDRSLWLVDKGFSLAEVGYAPYLARLRHLVLFERHPRVAEWSTSVSHFSLIRPVALHGRTRQDAGRARWNGSRAWSAARAHLRSCSPMHGHLQSAMEGRRITDRAQ